MAVFYALVGAALLFFGRKAFWLFVAGAGFVAGISLANQMLQGPEWVSLIIGLGIGFLAALLAVLVQRFAISLAGFLVGGYLFMQFLVPFFHLEHGWLPWLAFILGGVVGVALVGAFLDWALIILSSLAGASLIIEGFNLRDVLGFLVFITLIVIGMSYQARELREDRRKSS